jgi:hypothetical protein
MSIVSRSLLATAAMVALTWSIPAHALSMHECSTKYRAAQTANSLNGMGWKEFRKAPSTTTMPDSTKPSKTSRIYNTAPGNAVFPNVVAQKYAGRSAGRARMMTCLDQYRMNKTDNMNGGLKWIERGGGYYSECNKRLKEANAQNSAAR